ncbi:nucleoside hydrolase [Sporosarcina pasteurii]|uniref:Pyrimidine-specific ribonucleoside hydrolase rihA n=1 Tax=Sporosarcina pasteurii TaxID=1474 RepID=A0A380BHZ8_SPOPA|nr:nucleoside hydrolase [Sporosarcina pasteurii]MDS9470705.1 nucleoside hydrolase [Sporosarcina pasteurii]QBQ05613.1 nucleoside hydrolase [Sporosarcina pasteurii]SUJ01672.1 Pyrimidine-specific ribonucleoside hydrolase rihA [Sporosarcina pasteurii]
MKKVILDVDTGIDDAYAIIYAIESKQLDLLGITGVNGNVPIDYVMKNTKKILKLIGNEEVKAYRGASLPLLTEPNHEFRVHGKDGIGDALDHITVDDEESDIFAPDFMIEQAKKHKGDITFIMVGPLTNLALALRKEPRLAEWVSEVVIMGGLVTKAGMGNKLPNAEFNIFADAEAAKIVFHSGLSLKLVGLDVTHKTFLTRERMEELKGTKYYDFIVESSEVFRGFSKQKYGIDGCALHDPLTIGVAIDSSIVQTEKHFVEVETQSELNYGQTICDFRNIWKQEPNMEVCLDVENEKFVTMFIDTLKQA